MPTQPVTILTSEEFMLPSKHTSRQYRIMIGLPHHYYDEPAKKWPVIYLLDGNWLFGTVTEMTRFMAWCKTTTDAIVVGIGYPQNKKAIRAGNEELFRRDFDFTPERDDKFEKEAGKDLKQKVVTGGADQFIKFIQFELMPLVEKRYRVKPKKCILAGHSLGGLFTAYALLKSPILFKSYIISSPSLWYHNKYMFDYEENFSKHHKTLPANAFFSVGEMEEFVEDGMATNMLRFVTLMESRKYKGLNLVKKFFSGENHCEVIPPALQAGLKWALKK